MTRIEDRVVAAPKSNIAPEMLDEAPKGRYLDVQEVGKWKVNGLFHLLTNGVFSGYNPFTNHLPSSRHIK